MSATRKPAVKAPARKRPRPPAPRQPRTKAPAKTPHGPFETNYSGTVFRSRAEARWAIFFDLMGWEWDYEPCPYRLGDLGYLPDFYLAQSATWVEVKGPTYLDAASMGKVASAAAGPHPLPSRSAPYHRARAVVLVGPVPGTAALRPVHQLVRPAGPGLAGFHPAVWEDDQSLTSLAGKPWLTVPANGAKTQRRPSAKRAQEILAPAGRPWGTGNHDLARAFDLAGAVRFDDRTGELVRTTPASLRAELSLRRRGRPLGTAA